MTHAGTGTSTSTSTGTSHRHGGLERGPEAWARAAIMNRGYALKSLQTDITSPEITSLDSAVAGATLLSDQAAYEGDYKAYLAHIRYIPWPFFEVGSFHFCILMGSSRGVAHLGTMAARHPLANHSNFYSSFHNPAIHPHPLQLTALQADAHGLNCLTSLLGIGAYLRARPDRFPVSFTGEDGDLYVDRGVSTGFKVGDSKEHGSYGIGGLTHLISLAGDVYSLRTAIVKHLMRQHFSPSSFKSSSSSSSFPYSSSMPHQSRPPEPPNLDTDTDTNTNTNTEMPNQRDIIQHLLQVYIWLAAGPEFLIQGIYRDEAVPLVLLAYRLALDIVLLDCHVLLSFVTRSDVSLRRSLVHPLQAMQGVHGMARRTSASESASESASASVWMEDLPGPVKVGPTTPPVVVLGIKAIPQILHLLTRNTSCFSTSPLDSLGRFTYADSIIEKQAQTQDEDGEEEEEWEQERERERIRMWMVWPVCVARSAADWIARTCR